MEQIIESLAAQLDIMWKAFLITFGMIFFTWVLLSGLWIETRKLRRTAEAIAEKNGLTLIKD